MSAAAVASLLPLPVVIPICGAVAAPLLARVQRQLPLVVSALAMLGSTAVLCVVATRVYSGNGQVLSHFFGHWGPVDGHALGVAFAADPFGLTFALVTAALGMLLLVAALSELGELGPRELGGFACLFQLLLAALIGAALTADTINLFVWFEVAALSSYGLTGFFLERPIALEAAFKVLVLTSIGGFVVFIGAAVLYADHGALNFGQLYGALAGHVSVPDLFALGLLVAGFATKAGLAPFHGWLPDAHTAAPGAVSALFSALMVDLGIVGLVRVALLVYGHGGGHAVLGVLAGLGVVSAVLGALLALAQDDLKRLLAWDTISQMGVLVVGFATVTPAGVAGATYHLVNHALFKALLFLCAGAIVHATGETSMLRMGGLARRRPLLAAGFTVGVLAIAGVPPMNGFASLGLIHEGLRESGQPGVFAATLLAQVITVAALGRAAYLAFYRRRSDDYEHLEPLRVGMRVTLAVLGAACVAFGVLAEVVVARVAAPSASVLLDARTYARGVLAGTADVPHLAVSFSYGNVSDLLVAFLTTALGAALAAVYVRVPEPRPIRVLRAVHTGSVNDYAGFAAAGLLTVLLVLLA
jgi:multicomponent Na+:H+ antiporter subunit D